MSFLDDLGKFREVGLEPLLERVGRAGDGLVAGDAQTLEHVGCGQRRLGALLDGGDNLAHQPWRLRAQQIEDAVGGDHVEAAIDAVEQAVAADDGDA